MKKILSIILCTTLALALTACGDEEAGTPSYDIAEAGTWTDGTYTQTAEGYGDPFDVTVTIAGGNIQAVEIGANTETKDRGSRAVDQLPSTIVEAQTYDVDVVTSATISSNAIKDATARCLQDASK